MCNLKDELTIKEAEEFLNRKERMIRSYIKDNKLRVRKVRDKHNREKILISLQSLQRLKEELQGLHISTEKNDPATNVENIAGIHEVEVIPAQQSKVPLQIIDVGRNFLAEVDEKILSSISANNEKLIKQFQDMLNLQTENTTATLDKQREYFEGIITRSEEKSIQLINENKNMVMELQIRQDNLEENLKAKVRETEEKIEAWREEQKNRNRTWWKKLFKK